MEIKINLDVTENLKAILENLIDALREIKPRAMPADEKPKARRAVKKSDEAAPKADAEEKAEAKPEQPEAEAEATKAVEISTNSVEHNPPEAVGGESETQAAETTDDEAEAGKGQTGAIIAELTSKMIARINDENHDRARINKNLRAACEKAGLQFATVPALIQAIGYGNAYKACTGEG